jgi:NADPH-dependent stearoyl-CoA 9-desaturase
VAAPEPIDRTDPPANAPVPAAWPAEVRPAPFRLPPSAAHLTAEQVEELGRELDAIRRRHEDDLGEVDATYIRRLIALQRGLEAGGRALLHVGVVPPAWIGGVAALALSKILDNMEIGHNVLHGQYDWMEDPDIHSRAYEWDLAAPADQWKSGHNVIHHTWTNVVGKDRDVGYGVLRVTEQQPWRARDLANPLTATVLAFIFEYGIALHGIEMEEMLEGDHPLDDAKPLIAAIRAKAGSQAKRDYLLFPLLAGPAAPVVLAGNVTANVTRNLWAFTVIFCGHFPDGVEMFTEEDIVDETRARWYLRQMLGSANLTGGPFFHLLTGNLSHQIEHHLFPDLPARRYADIAVEVRDLFDRYGLEYNAGPLHRQFGTVVRRIVRLSLPDATASGEGRFRVRRELRKLTAPVSRRIDELAAVGRETRGARRAVVR